MARLVVPVVTSPAVPPGVEAFAARLTNDAQQARLHNLEASLQSSKARHKEELQDVDALLSSARLEIGQLQTALSQKDQQLTQAKADVAELVQNLAARDAALVEREREIAHLHAAVQGRDSEVQRLHTQVKLLLAQLHSSESDASAARLQKEQSLAPLSLQAADLQKNLANKDRQLQLSQQEVGYLQHRSCELRASAAEQQSKAAQVQSAQEAALAHQGDKIRHLESLLESQERFYKQNEQSLKNRCRLMQSWCFRMWWSLEGGDTLAPGLLSKNAAANLSAQSEKRPRARLKESGTPAVLHVPLPDDWCSVLRFQSSLFHWLTAEAVRGKALRLRNQDHDVELPLLRDAERRRRASPSRQQDL